MKHLKIIFTALCLFGVAALQAQNMVVYHTDGTRTTIAVSAIDSIRFEEPPYGGYAFADLGLSVLWASYNVGAESAAQTGKYYAWGETTSKRDYSESNYRYYVNDQYQSIGTNICGTKYDAARVLWGEGWRMPSLEEINELTSQCTWTWTTTDGVNGYRVTGPSGASIFLPAAGYNTGTEPTGVGQKGFYWCGTQSAKLLSAAHNINFTGYTGQWTASRAYGFSIRPVHDR